MINPKRPLWKQQNKCGGWGCVNKLKQSTTQVDAAIPDASSQTIDIDSEIEQIACKPTNTLTWQHCPGMIFFCEKPQRYWLWNCVPFNWFLRNLDVHYCSQINLPLILILSKVHPVPSITMHLLQIHFNIILPSMSWPP